MPVVAVFVGTFVLWIAAKGELNVYVGFATRPRAKSGQAPQLGATATPASGSLPGLPALSLTGSQLNAGGLWGG